MTKYIGYARVSRSDQNINLQVDALEDFGVSKVYSEKLSGTSSDKPELYKAIDELKSGDALVVYRVDRLSRSLRDLLDITSVLTKEGIALIVTEQPGVNILTPEGRMQFYMSAIISEYERDVLSSRTIAGLNAARARGRIGGRRDKMSGDQKSAIVKLYRDQVSVSEIAESFDISRPTVYRIVRSLAV